MKRILKDWKDMEKYVRESDLLGNTVGAGDWAEWFIGDCTIPFRGWLEWTDQERDEYIGLADNSGNYSKDIALALDIATRPAPAHKPCPFCGGRASMFGPHLEDGRYHVRCVRCDARTVGYANEAEAWQAWDRRTTDE